MFLKYSYQLDRYVLPNHKFRTGDKVTYQRNTGDNIGIATNRANADLNVASADLPEGVPYFVAKLTDDLIGLSTVRIGLGTPGDGVDPEDVFVGAAASTKGQSLVYFTGIGTGVYHSLKIAYDKTVKGSFEKNLITVSTASSHGWVIMIEFS